MFAIADTRTLAEDGVITAQAKAEIEARSRAAMVSLAINMLLCAGILAATFGLIFWLADTLAVAATGTLLLALGLVILAKSGPLYAMFGNAAALIGAGMLIGGAGLELIDKFPGYAGWVMLAGGAMVVAIAARAFVGRSLTAKFVVGSIVLMGLALHLAGLGYLAVKHETAGLPLAAFHLYCTAAMIGAGWLLGVRLITALAIIPFAQLLDTGTFYRHALYAFYSPESTLSIVTLTILLLACLFVWRSTAERTARHARILGTMAFVVANLCALVGSLWGDLVGETIWGPGRFARSGQNFDDWQAAREAFRQSALFIPDIWYAVIWAIALTAVIAYASMRANRALFNAGVTFAAIHAYTQAFESLYEEPLAYVIGGLAAIPLAWAIWRLNVMWFATPAKTISKGPPQ